MSLSSLLQIFHSSGQFPSPGNRRRGPVFSRLVETALAAAVSDPPQAIFPPESAVLGACQDGQPVWIDFNGGGPILIAGERGCGKTTLLMAMLQSAIEHDTKRRVLFSVITEIPELFEEIIQPVLKNGQCLGIYSPNDESLDIHMQQIAGLVEKRARRRSGGPPLLLLIDDLKFIRDASTTIRFHLETILQDGTKNQVWCAAGLESADCQEMGRWTRYFPIRILGRMSNSISRRLAILGDLDTEKMEANRQFAVEAAGQRLFFKTPWISYQPGQNPNNEPDSSGQERGENDEYWNVVV